MKREQSRHLIDTYCDDLPPNEERAINRLICFPATQFDRDYALENGIYKTENQLADASDSLIYGD